MTTARFTAAELIDVTQGDVVCGFDWARDSGTYSLSTDTRTVGEGMVYIPLKGERFDGHDYLSQALEKGAFGAIVSRAQLAVHPEWKSFSNIIAVDEPLMAYLAMARHHRRKLNPKVVAVTGSSGKTTTKDMLFAALSPSLKTQRTEKNYNNEVGLCQTLLALQPETELLIVEMAMRGLHQIDLLSLYGEPDIAVVNNVGPAHIGLLGSMENIALAKCEIFVGLNPDHGQALVNADDALLLATAQKLCKSHPLETYSLKEVEDIAGTPEGGIAFRYQDLTIRLSVPGEHNVSNALAILKVGKMLGIPLQAVAKGLESYVSESGRFHKTPLAGYRNAWLINDAYNANPSSMKASLKAFLELPLPGLRRVLVIGAMNELGEFSQAYHEELGEWLSHQKGIEMLYAVGEDARWISEKARTSGAYPVLHLETAQAVAESLKREGFPLEDTILFLKGSRTFQLEAIPQALALSQQGAS